MANEPLLWYVCKQYLIGLLQTQLALVLYAQVYLRETANAIVAEQSPKQLLLVRQRLYELLTKCIPTEVVMKVWLPCQLILYLSRVFNISRCLTGRAVDNAISNLLLKSLV